MFFVNVSICNRKGENMKKHIFIFVCLLCVAILLSGCDMAPVKAFGYTSSAVFYVNYSDVLAYNEQSACDTYSRAGEFIQTYINICDSNKVLEKVKETSGISDGFTVNIEALDDTEIIEISVSSWDKQVAYDVCVAYTQVVPEVVPEIVVGSNVKIIDLPKVPA